MADPISNGDLVYWGGVLRWRKTGIPYVVAVPTPLWEYPINGGGYQKEKPKNPDQGKEQQ